ncbi:MAG: hypothetical protein O6946_05720, partial [Gammaproteobacteria bacterium]|nr:hypothetical protein [Gammaproteobacteria bacterium]
IDDLRGFPVGFTKLFFEAKIDAGKKPLFFESLAEHEMEFIRTFSVPAYVRLDRVDDAYRVVNMDRNPKRFGYLWVIWRSDMTAFRQDPRFAELMAELGLMDFWREHGWPDACQPAGDSLICV